MSDLALLFSPSSPSSARPPVARPSRSRSRSPSPSNPLFYSPGPSPARRPGGVRGKSKRPREAGGVLDVDAELEMEIRDYPDLGQGEGGGARRGPPPAGRALVDFQMPAGSRVVVFDDPLAGLGGAGGDEEGAGKKRRVMAKVDVERLMGPRGFPKLMQAAKRFKPRGKGQEAGDLRDLLALYQMWAHDMFPKGDFAGTIQRVETVCKTRRMESAIKGYREAFYPPPKSPTPPASPGLTPPPDELEVGGGGDEDGSEGVTSAKRMEPLFDRGGDGPDDDELRAMEEMERGDGDGGGTAPFALEEEDEWEGLYD